MSLTVKLVVKDQKDALEYIDVHDKAVLQDIKERLLQFVDFYGCDVFWCRGPEEGEEIPMTVNVGDLTVEFTDMFSSGAEFGSGIEFVYGNIKHRDKVLTHFDVAIATPEELARARKRLAGRKRWVRVVGRFFEYVPGDIVDAVIMAVKKAKPWDMPVGSKTKIDSITIEVPQRHCMEIEGLTVCVTEAEATYSYVVTVFGKTSQYSYVAKVFAMTVQPSKYGMHIEDTVQPITAY